MGGISGKSEAITVSVHGARSLPACKDPLPVDKVGSIILAAALLQTEQEGGVCEATAGVTNRYRACIRSQKVLQLAGWVDKLGSGSSQGP